MSETPNIVLVHGAWADGSCWSAVIASLQADGYTVTAPQFPLTSLAADVARLRQVLHRRTGPTVVVGHSYGGHVMTALGTDAAGVAALVYVAAFALDEGESLGALLGGGPPTPALAHLIVDEQGFAWLPEEDFVGHFASGVDPDRARVLCAVQQGLSMTTFEDVMGVPAWKSHAAPGTIELMRYHALPEVRANVWDKQFPGQVPAASVVATTPAGNAFELEGSELRIVEVGHTDTDNTTVLHVPSIGLVVAGDAVYNGVHQYLAESANGGIQKWIKALDTIAALQPRRVVASHKNPALDDDSKSIGETRGYLEDAERLSQTSHSALEFYNAMMERYPSRLNPTALWFWGARVLFPVV